MKRSKILGVAIFAAMAFTACTNSPDLQTSPNGVQYKIFDGGSKDSTKEGDIIKMNMTLKVSGSKDTVLTDTYGKMPMYDQVRVIQPGQPHYDPSELFRQLKKGDSMIAVLYIDSVIAKGLAQEATLPPFFKRGDKLTFTYKVLEIFSSDSLGRADMEKEQTKEQERLKVEMETRQKAETDSLKKSGGIDKQNKEVTDYLAKKGLTNYITTPLGAYVVVTNPGTGAQVADSKYVTVKYNGKHLANDSSFQASSFTTQIAGPMGSIKGFEDGLKQFKEGGKGTIYIPGYLAYASTPPPGSPFKPFEPLYFEVEIQKVSDTEPAPNIQMPQEHSADDGHGH